MFRPHEFVHSLCGPFIDGDDMIARFLRRLADRLDPPAPAPELPLSDALRQEAIDAMFTPQFRASVEAALDIVYADPLPTAYTRKLRAIQGGRR